MLGQTLTAAEAALEEVVNGAATTTQHESEEGQREETHFEEDAEEERHDEEVSVETADTTEEAPPQATRPDWQYQHGASLMPQDDDEQVFVTRGDLKRIVTDAIREHSQARAVTGSHLQAIADEAPEFFRLYASQMEAALEDLPDPRVRARKESVNYAAGAALARRIAQGANWKEVILEAADLIRGERTPPTKREPTIIKEPDPRRAVPSGGAGRSTASVSTASRQQRSSGSNLKALEQLYGFSAEEAAYVASAPELHQGGKR
jgi:hypothetical protein